MAIKTIDTRELSRIADAIRAKTGKTEGLEVVEMAKEIAEITSGGDVDTSDATASADEILNGETAYVDGEKITGTFTIDNELTAQDDLISQIQTALKNKSTGGVDIDEELMIQDNLIAQIQTALNNKINAHKKEVE